MHRSRERDFFAERKVWDFQLFPSLRHDDNRKIEWERERKSLLHQTTRPKKKTKGKVCVWFSDWERISIEESSFILTSFPSSSSPVLLPFFCFFDWQSMSTVSLSWVFSWRIRLFFPYYSWSYSSSTTEVVLFICRETTNFLLNRTKHDCVSTAHFPYSLSFPSWVWISFVNLVLFHETSKSLEKEVASSYQFLTWFSLSREVIMFFLSFHSVIFFSLLQNESFSLQSKERKRNEEKASWSPSHKFYFQAVRVTVYFNLLNATPLLLFDWCNTRGNSELDFSLLFSFDDDSKDSTKENKTRSTVKTVLN